LDDPSPAYIAALHIRGMYLAFTRILVILSVGNTLLALMDLFVGFERSIYEMRMTYIEHIRRDTVYIGHICNI